MLGCGGQSPHFLRGAKLHNMLTLLYILACLALTAVVAAGTAGGIVFGFFRLKIYMKKRAILADYEFKRLENIKNDELDDLIELIAQGREMKKLNPATEQADLHGWKTDDLPKVRRSKFI